MATVLADIFGPDLLIVVLVIVVVLFGGAAIPKLARNLGSAQHEFKKGLAEGHKAGEAATAEDAGQAERAKTDGPGSATA